MRRHTDDDNVVIQAELIEFGVNMVAMTVQHKQPMSQVVIDLDSCLLL
jgi:hypothetical protein